MFKNYLYIIIVIILNINIIGIEINWEGYKNVKRF